MCFRCPWVPGQKKLVMQYTDVQNQGVHEIKVLNLAINRLFVGWAMTVTREKVFTHWNSYQSYVVQTRNYITVGLICFILPQLAGYLAVILLTSESASRIQPLFLGCDHITLY